MTSPRKAIGKGDVRVLRKTYKHGNTITYDPLVANGHAGAGWAAMTVSTDDTMQLADIDNRVNGRLEKVEPDGFCVVSISGELTFKAGASASVTPGKSIVGAQGASSALGYIKEVGAPTTTAATLAQLNALQAARGVIRNNDDLTAVIVDLRA